MSGVKRYMHISPLCEAAPLLMANYPMATEYVLASDYDRDTQALKERLSDRALDQMRQLEELIECQTERDALRAQVEAMRAALRIFVGCAYPVSATINQRGHNWCEAYLDQALDTARAALQEVKP